MCCVVDERTKIILKNIMQLRPNNIQVWMHGFLEKYDKLLIGWQEKGLYLY